MSETSESLHIRTEDVPGCVATLRQFGFSGFVFRGTHGWLTAVPYGGPEGLVRHYRLMPALAKALAKPVLIYSCAEDFHWGFHLWLPDGRSTSYTATYPELAEEAAAFEANHPELAKLAEGLGLPATDGFDEAVLAEVVAPERVRPFLNLVVEHPTSAAEPADGFAQALGLAEFKWLSPDYVTRDPEDARQRGGEEFGEPGQMAGESRL